MTSDDNSVTGWIAGLKIGDEASTQKLWERYFARLVAVARAKVSGRVKAAADEEDVALSAFDSFCRAATAGRFPRLADRDDLWRLMVVITARKAQDLLRRDHAAKRGGGREPLTDGDVRGGGGSRGGGGDDSDAILLETLAGHEPDPGFAAMVAEQCALLMDALREESLKSIALQKMEGWSNEEIAERMGVVPRTVERKLRLIRSLWEERA